MNGPLDKTLRIHPAIWERMFEEIPSDNFGLNFDPSHFIWLQMDYLKPLTTFADRIFHVHAKDVRLDRERLNEVGILATPLQYHTPKLPGLGDVDWGRFFSVLSDTGYEGSVCVEVEGSCIRRNFGDASARLKTESSLPTTVHRVRRCTRTTGCKQNTPDLKKRGLLRHLRTVMSAPSGTIRLDGRKVVLLGSNNYLGLRHSPACHCCCC